MKLKRIPIVVSLLVVAGLALAGLMLFLTPTTAASAPAALGTGFPIIADFEGGVPAGWFAYSDPGNPATIDTETVIIGDADPDAIPGQVGNNEVLSVTVSAPSWAGFGAGLGGAQDWSDYDALSFWFFGENSGTTYTFEIQTASTDNRRASFTDTFVGWRQITLPFHIFGAGGVYDVSQITTWVMVLDNTVGSFRLDDLQLVNILPFADFEGGAPAGFFVYSDPGNPGTIAIETVVVGEADPDALPGQIGNNELLSVTVNFPSWGGFGAGFGPTEDWSDMQGVGFWFYGEDSGLAYEFEVQSVIDGNRRASFVDNVSGWQYITLPFATFGAGGAYDVSQVSTWVLILDGKDSSFRLNDLAVYGDAGNVTRRAAFSAETYNVMEGDTATITVTLNVTSTEPVSVTYATSDGSATNGVDYTPSVGVLTFAPGESSQTFTVDTIDNDANDDERTVNLTLSDPINTELGIPNPATLIIGDDELDSPTGKSVIIEDYEDGLLPMGTDADGVNVGYSFYAGGSSTVTIGITDTMPAPVPGAPAGNNVLQEDLFITSGSFAGFLYAFTNDTVDEWVPQNWQSYAGIGFWLYGNNTGGVIFIDVLDNRGENSTTDDAERWSIDIADDFSGWRYFAFDWSEFNRKDVGNGAPNDGFNLTEVHGYAFGGFGAAPMDHSYYIDDVALLQRVTVIDDFERDTLPAGTDGDGITVGYYGVAGGGGAITFTTTNALPTPVPGSLAGNRALQENMTLPPNAFAVFVNAFTNDSADTWVPQDWSGYEGVCFWLYGNNTGGILFVDILDNRGEGSTTDDAERFSLDIPDNFDGWQFFQFTWDEFNRKDIGNGAPNDGFNLTEVHGYAVGGFGSVDMGTNDYYLDDFSIWGISGADLPLLAEFESGTYDVVEGGTAVITVSLSMTTTEPVTVTYASAEAIAVPDRDFTPVSGSVVIPAGDTSATFTVDTIDEAKADGDKNAMLVLHSAENAELGFRRQAVLTVLDDDPVDPTLIDDFEGFHPYHTINGVDLSVLELMAGDPDALPGQGAYEQVLAATNDGRGGPDGFARTFVEPQDWSAYAGFSFWFAGSNSGAAYTVELQDNQAATTAGTPPSDWVLVWSDEFNDPAGTPPNPNLWTAELGDGSLVGNPGWGNAEFQTYTNDPANAATDGNGNLAITMLELDPNTTDLVCYYGPCRYTSARLNSWYKAEFEYGRIEARIKLPTGEPGLWPAFWSLGTDFADVGWPQTGEMDIMEYVSRIPNEIFGTIHGPGYAGGASFGDTYDFGVPASDAYHTYAIEWSPDEIHWTVDGIDYHEAIPADVDPNEWVFNHPFFLLLNMAIGGNFGGAISPDLTFPQTTLVDYVRVYQAPDTAERFTANFVDGSAGWQQVTIPFADFSRSAQQPAGAPNDGLGLSEVWGYGLQLPNSGGAFRLDQVRVVENVPTSVALSNLAGESGLATVGWLLLPLLLALGVIVLGHRRRRVI